MSEKNIEKDKEMDAIIVKMDDIIWKMDAIIVKMNNISRKMDEVWKTLPYEITSLILEQLCIGEIKERLRHMKCSFILEMLEKNKAVISGSFILQCLLGENYNSDIDIFIPYTTDMCRGLHNDETRRLIAFLHLNGVSLENSNSLALTRSAVYVQGDLIGYTEFPDSIIARSIPEFNLNVNYRCPFVRFCESEDRKQSVSSSNSIQYLFVYSSWSEVQPLEHEIFQQLNIEYDIHCGSVSRESYRDCLDKIVYTRSLDVPWLNERIDSYRYKINMIVLGEQLDTKKYIEDTFDADICSIYYDGKSLNELFHYLSRKIINKQMTMKLYWKNNNRSIQNRYEQIQNRIYRFLYVDTRFEKSCKRIKKYMKRNYIVKPQLIIDKSQEIYDHSKLKNKYKFGFGEKILPLSNKMLENI